MKLIKNIFKILVLCIIFPILFFGIITSRSNFLFNIRTFIVPTGSMVPTIPIGSLIITKREAIYEVGDIITFQRINSNVTHRIIAIKHGDFQTKGDHNNAADPQLVVPGSILGKDIFIIPYVGYIAEFLKSIPGFLIFIALPIILFIISEAIIIKREWEKTIEEKMKHKLSTQQQE